MINKKALSKPGPWVHNSTKRHLTFSDKLLKTEEREKNTRKEREEL